MSCEFRLLFYLVKKLVIDYPDSALHIVIDIFGKSNIDKHSLDSNSEHLGFFRCMYFMWQKVYLIKEKKVEYTPKPLCTVHSITGFWPRRKISMDNNVERICDWPTLSISSGCVHIFCCIKTEILQNSSINKPTESYKSWEIVSFNWDKHSWGVS